MRRMAKVEKAEKVAEKKVVTTPEAVMMVEAMKVEMTLAVTRVETIPSVDDEVD